MMKAFFVLVALCAAVPTAYAEDVEKATNETAPPLAPPPAGPPRRAIQDLSLSVTLTGHEIQALANALRAEAQAQAAAAAAAPVTAKITKALTPPADDKK